MNLKNDQSAFGSLDFLIIVALIVTVVVLAVPSRPHSGKRQMQRITCVNNMKQIGIAARYTAMSQTNTTVSPNNGAAAPQ